jgi:hypothetical protein
MAVQAVSDFAIHPVRKLSGHVAGTYLAGGDDFVSSAVSSLRLGLDGIEGDFHAGRSRRSGGREPWYGRGTEIRNERQISIVAPDELSIVAERLGLAEIDPGWIGANLLIEGVPSLSMLPAGTLMFFRNGVTLKVDAQNGPCKIAGRAIAAHVGASDPEAMALLFPKVAKRLRGLVAWVEKPGIIETGEAVSLRVPEQWIYQA